MKKAVMLAAMLLAGALAAFGGCEKEEAAGTYTVGSSLSCYIPAMGGVEFGEPLLTQTRYTKEEDGSMSLTLYFTKSSVTNYSITCYTFIDAEPNTGADPVEGEPEDGTIGYYDADNRLVTEGVSYTLSEDTTENNLQEQVHYVDSITFPIAEKKDTYYLTFYINSTVMGAQFKITADGSVTRAATLTVDWDDLTEVSA